MAEGSTNTIGFTAETLKHLMLDSGAVYKNYGLTGEALMGCTSGGCELDIVPKTREIKADGIKGSWKGGTQIISVDCTLKINFLEVTTDILKAALMADVDSVTNVGYDTITSKTVIELTDYIDNIALVSSLSGSTTPVIIILKNALGDAGIKFSSKDSQDNILPCTFTAHISPDTPSVLAYEIRYPVIV